MPALSIFISLKTRRRSNSVRAARLLALLVLVCVCAIFVHDGHAATIAARSCSYTDVSNAVSSAQRGDVVTVPACTTTVWSSPLKITKAITLQGAGPSATYIKSNITPGSTTWYHANNCLIYFYSSSVSADENEMVRITGFNSTWAARAGLFMSNKTAFYIPSES